MSRPRKVVNRPSRRWNTSMGLVGEVNAEWHSALSPVSPGGPSVIRQARSQADWAITLTPRLRAGLCYVALWTVTSYQPRGR